MYKRLLFPLFIILLLVSGSQRAAYTKDISILDNALVVDGSQDLLVQFYSPAPKGTDQEVRDWLHAQKVLNETSLRSVGIKAICYAIAQSCIVPGNTFATASVEASVDAISSIEGVTWITNAKTFSEPIPVEISLASVPTALPWGITDSKAPQVWSWTKGVGARVANMDTGVDYQHPELSGNWTGGWFDPVGGSAVPVDTNGHGTHTMGTMVGQSVGMAPDAQWLAVRVCSGGCATSSILAGADWLVDWKLANPGPLVVNNSWGAGSPQSGLDPMIENWRSFGIIPVFSAGNSGPSCQTAGYPAGNPSNPIAVAAHNVTRTISSFSSRGKDAYEQDFPDLSGPGEAVYSSVPGGGYELYSGTSMAAPHVSGAIALLQSLKPGLTENEAKNYLFDSADYKADSTCGNWTNGNGNNVYGNGFWMYLRQLHRLLLVGICKEL